MKLYVIGHEDTVLGFSLIGVEGLATSEPSAALQRLEELRASGDVGVVLITAGLAHELGDRMRGDEDSGALPIVLEVPAPDEPLDRPPIRELVRRALGAGV